MKTTLLLLLALFSLSILQAQVPPALETTSEEVVVTGARIARPENQSPQRVTVIDSATIARAVDLGQLLNEQAGIHVNGVWSNPGKDRSVFLRNGANQYTLILVDGQPLLDPSSLGGAVDLRLLDLSGIERIEILRGGTSVLYGSDAVAGVVNLITRKDLAPSSPTVHLRAAAQSYGTVEMNASMRKTTEKLSYTASLSYFDTRGISEAVVPAGSTETFDNDSANRISGSVSLDYRPNENLSIRPSLRMASFDGDYDNGSFQDGANTYTNDLINPSLAVDYNAGDWTYAGRYTLAATDRVFNSAFGEFSFIGRAHQADVFATLNRNRGGSLTFGAQYRDENIDIVSDKPSATTISPYAQYTLNTPGGFLLDLGARYNQHSEFGGQLNGSLGLGLQTTNAWSTRLNLSTAFQSPTLDQLAGPFGANPELAPQVSLSAELSTRLADPAGKYQVSLALFRREISDVIVFTSLPDFTSLYQNQDELVDNGIELEGFVALTSALRLNGNITFVKGTLTSPDGTGGTIENEDFPRRPRTSGTLGLTFNPASPFLARLSGLYTGERPDVWFDQNFARFDVNLDPYFLLNAYAEYQFLQKRNLTVFAEVRNLTDADFVEVTGFSTQGITLRGGVGVRF